MVCLWRLFNHPDLVGVLPILLENPESRSICVRDRKIPDFDNCSEIFKWILMILIQWHHTEYCWFSHDVTKIQTTKLSIILRFYLAESDIQSNFKNRTTCIKISIKRTIDLENILDRICPLRTLEMAFQSTKISKFSGRESPQTPLVVGPFTARLPCWLKNKKTRFYILKKFDSLSVLTWYPLNEKITKVR